MFALLITLVNVSSSMERSAVLDAIESSLMTALRNLEVQPTMTQIDRYGITISLKSSLSYIIFNLLDGCNPEVLDGQQWPETAPGSTAVGSPCPCTEAEGQLAGRVIRQCVGTYSSGSWWDAVDDSQCTSRLSGQLCALFEVSIFTIYS